MSTTNELPDDATHEQIHEFVDHLIAGEAKAAEGKPADDKAEGTTTEETSVDDEPPVDSDTVAEDGDDDSTEKVDEGQAWLTDDLKAEASARGITEEDLAGFTSREELDRTLNIFDRAALKAGRDAASKTDSPKVEEPKVQPTGKAPRGPDGKFVPKEEDGTGYKVSLDPEVYDEGVVKELNAINEHYAGRLKAMEDRLAQFEQADQQRTAEVIQERFDSIVDSLEQPELFGVAGKETKEQLANRQKLFEEHNIYLTGLQALGRQGKLDKASVSRVVNMAFAEHLSKQQLKNRTQKISRQSQKRMGGSAGKIVDASQSVMAEMQELYNRLERNG